MFNTHECPICLEVLDDDTQYSVTKCCKQTFHAKCIDKMTTDVCPLCRREMGINLNRSDDHIIYSTFINNGRYESRPILNVQINFTNVGATEQRIRTITVSSIQREIEEQARRQTEHARQRMEITQVTIEQIRRQRQLAEQNNLQQERNSEIRREPSWLERFGECIACLIN